MSISLDTETSRLAISIFVQASTRLAMIPMTSKISRLFPAFRLYNHLATLFSLSIGADMPWRHWLASQHLVLMSGKLRLLLLHKATTSPISICKSSHQLITKRNLWLIPMGGLLLNVNSSSIKTMKPIFQSKNMTILMAIRILPLLLSISKVAMIRFPSISIGHKESLPTGRAHCGSTLTDSARMMVNGSMRAPIAVNTKNTHMW